MNLHSSGKWLEAPRMRPDGRPSGPGRSRAVWAARDHPENTARCPWLPPWPCLSPPITLALIRVLISSAGATPELPGRSFGPPHSCRR